MHRSPALQNAQLIEPIEAPIRHRRAPSTPRRSLITIAFSLHELAQSHLPRLSAFGPWPHPASWHAAAMSKQSEDKSHRRNHFAYCVPPSLLAIILLNSAKIVFSRCCRSSKLNMASARFSSAE